MKLFKRKKDETKNACCGDCSPEEMTRAEQAKGDGAFLKILGTGCAKCNQLEAAAREAVEQLGLDITIDHVTDFAQIAAYGVMTTPALVMGGKVVSYGKVLKKDEVIALIVKNGKTFDQ